MNDSETADQGRSTHSWKNQGCIRPVQRVKGQGRDFKAKGCHHAGTTSLRSQQPTWAYRHAIDPLFDLTCPKCGEGQHTLEHWLIECSALVTTRLHLFEFTDVSVKQLSLEPAKSVTLAKESLRFLWRVCQQTTTTALVCCVKWRLLNMLMMIMISRDQHVKAFKE